MVLTHLDRELSVVRGVAAGSLRSSAPIAECSCRGLACAEESAPGVGYGSGIAPVPGVPSRPASDGMAAVNARRAKGQSWVPGWAPTMQCIPLPVATPHSAPAARRSALSAANTLGL